MPSAPRPPVGSNPPTARAGLGLAVVLVLAGGIARVATHSDAAPPPPSACTSPARPAPSDAEADLLARLPGSTFSPPISLGGGAQQVSEFGLLGVEGVARTAAGKEHVAVYRFATAGAAQSAVAFLGTPHPGGRVLPDTGLPGAVAVAGPGVVEASVSCGRYAADVTLTGGATEQQAVAALTALLPDIT